jgi:uncharacterized protein YwgA
MEGLISGWPILLTLYYAKKVPLHIKLQKMLFLVLSEAKLKIPYNFTKHEYGPYDPEIKIDFINLSNGGYMNVSCRSKPENSNWTYWTFSITKKGEEYVEKILFKSFSPKEMKKVESLVLKYNKMEWKELVSMVYKKYNRERGELENKKELIKKELNRIRSIWVFNYEKNNCEYTFTTLAMIDYITILLNKKSFANIDITHYNVLINFLDEMLNYWKIETSSFSFCKEISDCKSNECERFLDINWMYMYIQYLGEKFKILPATYSEEACLEDFEYGPESDKLWIAIKAT